MMSYFIHFSVVIHQEVGTLVFRIGRDLAWLASIRD